MADKKRPIPIEDLRRHREKRTSSNAFVPTTPKNERRDAVLDARSRYVDALRSGDDIAREEAASDIRRIEGPRRGTNTIARAHADYEIEER